MLSLFEGKPDHPLFDLTEAQRIISDLPDAHNSSSMPACSWSAFVPGNFYQALMGEKSREIKLTHLLAEGADYEQVGFEWVEPLSS